MRDPKNIEGLVELTPDFIGFIFYSKSPRFVTSLDDSLVKKIPKSIQRVGVFVNESLDEIDKKAHKYGLSYIQLHGDEDLAFSRNLKERGHKIIKVFRISDSLPTYLGNYEGVADYLLFDTASLNYGGSGVHFKWEALKEYNLDIPYLLSGGVQLEDIPKIKDMGLKKLVGIDVNSRFERSPGVKNLEKIKALKAVL